MAKTHALGLLVGEHRLTACNAYLARAVKVSDNVAEVDCSKCVKAIGASNSDEGLAADHRYRDPRTGELLPFSVTSIARSFDPGDPFGAGAAWGARLQREGKDWREVRDEAGDYGTRIHSHIARWAVGKSVEALPDEEPRLDAFAAFTKAKDPLWMESEVAVVTHGVGGRLDLIGDFDDAYTVVDIKSGTEHETTDMLQLAGYATADGIIEFDEQGRAVRLRPMPHIERAGCLYLRADGTAAWRCWLEDRAAIEEWAGHFDNLVKMRLSQLTMSTQRKVNR